MSRFHWLIPALVFVFPGLPSFAAEGRTTALVRLPPVSPLTTALNLSYYRAVLGKGDPSAPALSGPALNLEVEWLPFSDLWGKPAIGSTFGYQNIAGFKAGASNHMLHVMPVGLFASYHFDFLYRQWLVPYAKAGGLASFTQAGAGGRIQTAWQWTYGAGLSVSLGSIDTYSARHLDSGLGINDFFLTVEYVKTEPMTRGQSPDFSHEEFRFGIRFEI